MIELTEPQIWVLMGIFAASIFSIIGIQTASFNRNLTTCMAALRESMEAKFDAVGAKFDGLRAEMNARFDATNTKIDAIDRDVQVLSQRVSGSD